MRAGGHARGSGRRRAQNEKPAADFSGRAWVGVERQGGRNTNCHRALMTSRSARRFQTKKKSRRGEFTSFFVAVCSAVGGREFAFAERCSGCSLPAVRSQM